MNARPLPLLHWPGWTQIGYALLASVVPSVLFALIYGGADALARQHSFRIAWHLDVDRDMPLVPAAAVLYLSLNPLLWISPFVLRERRELRALATAISLAILVAGVFFVILPADEIFTEPTPTELAHWAGPYQFARAIALRYNYFPSLHVAFTVICIAAYSRYGSRGTKLGLLAWGAAIVASTLLTHQHYLLDVVGGALLGGLMLRFVYRPLQAAVNPSQSPESVGASLSDDLAPPA